MIYKKGRRWIAALGDGTEILCISKEVAEQQLIKNQPKWELWTPPNLEVLPLPEVREYDSLEELLAEED